MALTEAAAIAIAAGVSAAAAGGQTIANSKLNKKNRKWQEKMFARQNAEYDRRQDKQNLYNSPAEQKKRLIEAGMNPSLAYDNTTGSAALSADPTNPSMPGSPTTVPTDLSAVSELGQQLPTALNTLAQARYYDSLSDNLNGIDRQLKESQRNLNDSLSTLYKQEFLSEEERTAILSLQSQLLSFDLNAAKQDWDTGQSLVRVRSPHGEDLDIPMRLVPMYMDYASLVLSMNSAYKDNETINTQLDQVKLAYNIMSQALPPAELQAIIASLELGLLSSKEPNLTVTVDGKEEKITYRDLLLKSAGAEALEKYDFFVSTVERVSRKSGFDKTTDILKTIFSGATSAAAIYGATRGASSRRFGPNIYGNPTPAQARSLGMSYDNLGNLQPPTRLMY